MHETIKPPEGCKGIKSSQLPIPLDEVVKKQQGTMFTLQDDSCFFCPRGDSGEPLYKDSLKKTRHGEVKQSDKSIVLRASVPTTSVDAPAELMMHAAELIAPLTANKESVYQTLAKMDCLVGQTPHSRVFLHEGRAVVITEIGFDEPNLQVADIARVATPEQLKYIQQWLDPACVYQQEVAEVCALLRKARDRKESNIKILTTKTINYGKQ